ncbi:DNA-binding protein YbaB [Kitasatospora sp. MAA19]|uniref:YbaB/EbfC family nucleoid-associated protein n=1 Tax=unclassified Kitasatospora TaxID=2633591 RepID=UPI002475129F|nr:YbaB/EbfC family nucleoid-associated protein [Kitasatospora sp. MAA19]MDH6708737.1 DNA-binding protein YbaB [Kitasatospora sp. MAA19]
MSAATDRFGPDDLFASMSEEIGQAMEAMREHQAKAEAVQAELAKSSATVTSKDRMVTAKVGPQGQVLALTFHTTGYQEMAPAQLGKLLTDLLNEARAAMGEQVIQAMKSFEGVGDMLRLSLSGGSTLDQLLEPLRAMKPGYDDDAEAERRRAGRQEEFHE